VYFFLLIKPIVDFGLLRLDSDLDFEKFESDLKILFSFCLLKRLRIDSESALAVFIIINIFKNYIPLPLINLSNIATTAITRSMCTIPPKFPKNNPNAQRINKITAIV
jgi:hypothetical protein